MARRDPRFTESQRVEAARRGVSVSQVRVERGRKLGYSRSQSVGHPRASERLISTPVSVNIGGAGSPMSAVSVASGYDRVEAGSLIAGIYDLLDGYVTPEDFDARWAGKTVGGKVVPPAAAFLEAGDLGDFDPGSIGTP